MEKINIFCDKKSKKSKYVWDYRTYNFGSISKQTNTDALAVIRGDAEEYAIQSEMICIGEIALSCNLCCF